MHWLKAYAVTVYGIIILGIILIGGLANPQYDSGGFGFFYHFLLVPVLGFMFYVPQELLSSLNAGSRSPGQLVLSTIVGLSFCLGVDYLRYRLRMRKKT